LKDDGFSLIEVLASLVIFSIAIVGLVSMNTQSVRTATAVEDKMLASIVADNVIVEARRKGVRLGEDDGEERAKGHLYVWQKEIETTELENFYRITIKVRRADDPQVLIERVAYRGGNP